MNREGRRRAMGIVALAFLAFLFAFAVLAEPRTMSAREAHRLASRGEIVLVDIRSPREWRRTGIGASALPLSMHRPGFREGLRKALSGDKSTPVALICAVGGRSARMARLLTAAGYSIVIDVSEGMIGGRHGPGWIASGLPLKSYPD